MADESGGSSGPSEGPVPPSSTHTVDSYIVVGPCPSMDEETRQAEAERIVAAAVAAREAAERVEEDAA